MAEKKNLERGVVTIEATISLSLFIFVIIILLSIINIFTLQARMQVALNTTAKQISQYSYLYSLVGNGLQSSVKGEGKEVDNIDENLGRVVLELENLAGDVSTNGAGAVLDFDYSTIKGSISSTASSFEEIMNDPTILVYYLANEGINLAQNEVGEFITSVLMKGNLRTNKDKNSAESFLKMARVVEGPDGTRFGGLDFSDTEIFKDGSYDIKLSVKYSVKIMPLIPLDIKYHFSQMAYTEGWHVDNSLFNDVKKSSGSKKEEKQEEKQEKERIENTSGFWGEDGYNELIRSEGIKYYLKDGYYQTSGVSGPQLYNPETNELLYISSYNPLKFEGNETVEDIPEDKVRETIEKLVTQLAYTGESSGIKIQTDNGLEEILYGDDHPNTHLVLVIPEDPGLKELFEKVLEQMKQDGSLKGVDVELYQGYGLGARTIEVDPEPVKGD